MIVVLRNQLKRVSELNAPLVHSVNPKKKFSVKFATAGLLATLFTGVNYYFQNFVADKENERQKSLIERVSNDQVANDFLYKFNHRQSNDWQCKKITIDGSLKEGRFLVKKNRGNQEGYIVLAPFTVQRDKALTQKRKVQRRFVLNMGWIPKESKHLLKKLTTTDVLGENQYTQQNRIKAMQKQEYDQLLRDPNFLSQTNTIATVQAYVRRGQQREILNGRNNWRQSKLYKYIDLPFICRLFRITNEEQAGIVYLQRIPKTEQENQVVPIPATKEHVIDDLKQRIELNNNNRDNNVIIVGVGSFVSAIAIALL